MIVYDAAGVKTAISPDGSGSVYDAQGRRISASSATAQYYSFDNPPSAPNTYNDEFNIGTLDSKWTIGSAGTTNPATTGTIDYTASITTPIIDLATVPGWLMMQSDNSTGQTFWIRQPYSPATNATFFMRVGASNRNVSTGGESNLIIRLTNSGDANEFIACGTTHSGSSLGYFLAVSNNGVITTAATATIAENAPAATSYIALWKKSDVYHFGFTCANNGAFTYAGSVTKTGVTTFDQQQVEMTTANETPSVIEGVDFYRYYPSVVYGLSNPAA